VGETLNPGKGAQEAASTALAPVAVLASEKTGLREEAAALAERLSLPLRSPDDAGARADELLLVVGDAGLELWAGSRRRDGCASVDFARRSGNPGRRTDGHSPLERAVGRQPGRVVDATAGFGADAFALARAGHRVLACERSPVMVALLEDGLRRARLSPDLRPAAERLELRCEDAHRVLADLDAAPDAVYIDPMYPTEPRRKTALPPLEIQILRRLVGREADPEALLNAALASGARRVVIKRPPSAPPLPGPRTDQQTGKLARYDVYHCAATTSGQAR